MTVNYGNNGQRVRVAYIDDQLLFREALVNVFDASGSIKVALSANHRRQALTELREVNADSLLVGLDMQVNDAMASLREIRLLLPDLPICALVAVDRLERAREAISAGCRGAVSTAASLAMLIEALQTLAAGEAYVDPTLGGRLLAKTIMRGSLRNMKQPADGQLVTKASEISKN